MIAAMKPGSVIVDLAAERGGNAEGTVMDEKVVTDNGVTIVGYTDFPSRMASQASSLYATNIRHMMTDLTPEKDGSVNHNMEDDVIRGATVAHEGDVTFPPPPPKIQAIAAKPQEKPKELTPEEKREQEIAAFKAATTTGHIAGRWWFADPWFGPDCASKLYAALHRVCFVCVYWFQVIWNVSCIHCTHR